MAGFAKILLTGDATTEVEAEATLDLAGDVTVSGSGKSLTANDFRVGADTTLTIATGDVTQTGSYHTIAGEGGSDDQLDGISAGGDGQLLFIRPSSDSVTITVAHNQNAAGTNNILLNGDTSATLDDEDDFLMLIYDAGLDTNGAWVEVSRGSGGASLSDTTALATSTAAAAGSGTSASRDDHVHDIGVGSIDAANLFASGVVDATAIAANAVGNSEVDNSATDIAFAQIILTATASGTGTTTGTVYYDSDDNHLYVYQP